MVVSLRMVSISTRTTAWPSKRTGRCSPTGSGATCPAAGTTRPNIASGVARMTSSIPGSRDWLFLIWCPFVAVDSGGSRSAEAVGGGGVSKTLVPRIPGPGKPFFP